MKIAIISDIHDNIINLNLFFEQVKVYNVEKIIFLWDLSSTSTAKILSKSKIPIYWIFWNNNWDIFRMKYFLNENFKHGTKTFDFLEIDSRKIFISHYNELAIPMAKSWDFDAVFYWHNHLKYKWKVWNCLVVNPWEIVANRTWIASFAVYDTKTNDAEVIDIKNSISLNPKYYKNKL